MIAGLAPTTASLPRFMEPEVDVTAENRALYEWRMLFANWHLVESDFQEFYGIDFDEVANVKSWHWFRDRLRGLFARPRRLEVAGETGALTPTTRIGYLLDPPNFAA